MRNDLLPEAMRALPISKLWVIRGWSGKPAKSCHFPGESPGNGKKASCSVFTATTGRHAGVELLKDHRSGTTWDGPGLLAHVEGLTMKEACRTFISLSGVKRLDDAPAHRAKGTRKPAPEPVAPPAPEPDLPPLFDPAALSPRPLSSEDVEAIACLRGVSNAAVMECERWGVLSAVTLPPPPELRLPIPRESLPLDAWAFHSPDWQSFRVRPFACRFPAFSGKDGLKSVTPGGASCASPVWIGPRDAGRVLVVEGEADSLAAVCLTRREGGADLAALGLSVVCVFSSSMAIPSAALPLFKDRSVRILPHVTDTLRQGEKAACKWYFQLRPWARKVEIFSLRGARMPDGAPVGDLGDLARCPTSTLHSLRGVTCW